MNLALVLYFASLVVPCISSTQGQQSFLGIQTLLLGLIQVVLGVSGFIKGLLNLELNLLINSLLLIFPWLANVTIILTFKKFYLFKSPINRSMCVFGVFCTGTFWVIPKAMIGESSSIIDVNIELGGYIWIFVSMLLLYATSLADKPSKRKHS
jgi:hypothetical protein